MLRTALISLLSIIVGRAGAQETTAEPEQKHPIPRFDFCVAYVLRDPDARDARPDPEDPAKKSHPAGGILANAKKEIDVAALAGLASRQHVLNGEQAASVLEATTSGRERLPVMECYEPHHAFVFYTNTGKPVGCVEICFTCNSWKISPEGNALESFDGFCDLPRFAKLFVEFGLPLTPYTSFEDFEANKTRQIEFGKRREEESRIERRTLFEGINDEGKRKYVELMPEKLRRELFESLDDEGKREYLKLFPEPTKVLPP